MNILLTSVGRRPYLVRWFQEALKDNGLSGQVIAADLDPDAPSRAFADDFVLAPSADSSEYQEWIAATLAELQIDLAVSINDFELSEWARLPQTHEWDALVRLTPETQDMAEDKLAMSIALRDAGVPIPATWLASDADIPGEGDFVTKGRFGSASRGLRFADAAMLSDAVAEATREVTTRRGVLAREQDDFAPEDLVIVQERVDGTEYGLDVVCDLNGKFAGVLARRKIAMRAGETDRAEAVAPGRFEAIARSVTKAVPHPGTVDVDVLEDKNGDLWVIDINPRFGGGYPLSHVAGAKIPSAYVAWRQGDTADQSWLCSDVGVVAGKYVEAVRVS